MCNLYTNKAGASDLARAFKAQLPLGLNIADGEVYPGGHGVVLREEDGTRILQTMTWGFPLAQKSKKTGQPIKPKPVNNIADLTSFMWRFVAPRPEHRCIIPLTGFCEAEGERGSMTRTWFSVKDRPIFAWAGMWKNSDEWGPVYSGLMTDCNEVVRAVHSRMPVLLHEEDYDVWLRGSLDDVMSFQGRCFPDELTELTRTAEPWFRRRAEAVPA
jgi:putative SOS response-associated peptidase YedK